MNKLKMIIWLGLLAGVSTPAQADQPKKRWQINSPGNGIEWVVQEGDEHRDHIEMSGERISAVLRYGTDKNGTFQLERSLVWPMLRTIPNNTHASLMQRFAVDIPSLLMINGLTIQQETLKKVVLDGTLTRVSDCAIGYVNVGGARNRQPDKVIELTQTVFPSTENPVFCERYQIRNISEKPVVVKIPAYETIYKTLSEKGVDGSYTMISRIYDNGTYTVQPSATIEFGATFQALKQGETEFGEAVSEELLKRFSYKNEVSENLKLETPDPVLNLQFDFAKLRASESIFRTKGGLMHAPGGESYYAAIWANDQAEYVNPFFPYLGYEKGNESAMNSFRHFARFMNPVYEPIPSSIIAEGDDIWNGAGDRGDAAMIAYGASRYALASGKKEEGRQLWPLIEWCLEYCNRQLNEEGVVASDTDELENRFPSGDANLCTSALYYDALQSAKALGKELGIPASQTSAYGKQASQLRKNIESYFGSKVEGFDTYRYYKENDVLRSWICIPLTVGIHDRAQETIKALFSPRLWTDEGLLTEAGSDTFWDRSTLYALRGIFQAGATDQAIGYLQKYSDKRLLGDHVPYPIEAWPEGSQRHLSAESGLYCRIITEGLFGIRPVGLKSFSCSPRLPESWDGMNLRNIRAFDDDFDLELTRRGENKIGIVLKKDNRIKWKKVINDGESCVVQL